MASPIKLNINFDDDVDNIWDIDLDSIEDEIEAKKILSKLKQPDGEFPPEVEALWPQVYSKLGKQMLLKNYSVWGKIWNAGVKDTFLGGIKKAVNTEGPKKPGIIRETVDEYFNDHGLELAKALTETDMRQIKTAMSDHWGIGEREFANIFKDSISVSPERAKLIYRTEHHRAENAAVLKVSRKLRRPYKQWICIQDERSCHTCWEHANEVIPIDEKFVGHDKDGNEVYYDIPQDAHPNCYDAVTEVFTERGWKLFKDVTADDKVWTLNLDTNEPELDDQVRQIAYHYTGKMIHVNSKTFDCKVTPDHNMLTIPKKQYLVGGRSVVFKPAGQLVSGDRVPRSADWHREHVSYINVNGRKFDSVKFAAFIGWYVSEGNISKPQRGGWQIKISQSKQENRDEIIKLSKDLFGDVWVAKDAIYVPRVDDIKDYFILLGHASEKYIPDDIKQLSSECLAALLDTLVKGDGHRRKCSWNGHPEWSFNDEIIYTTSSSRLVSDITEIALKLGYRPSYYETSPKTIVHHNGTYTSRNPCYYIRLNKYKYSCITRSMINYVDYDDMVYCLEMAHNHSLYVRRNGRANWSGNCRCVMITLRDKDLTDEQRQSLISRGFITNDEEYVSPDEEEYVPLDDTAYDESGIKENRRGKCKKGTVDETFKCSLEDEVETKDSMPVEQKFKLEINRESGKSKALVNSALPKEERLIYGIEASAFEHLWNSNSDIDNALKLRTMGLMMRAEKASRTIDEQRKYKVSRTAMENGVGLYSASPEEYKYHLVSAVVENPELLKKADPLIYNNVVRAAKLGVLGPVAKKAASKLDTVEIKDNIPAWTRPDEYTNPAWKSEEKKFYDAYENTESGKKYFSNTLTSEPDEPAGDKYDSNIQIPQYISELKTTKDFYNTMIDRFGTEDYTNQEMSIENKRKLLTVVDLANRHLPNFPLGEFKIGDNVTFSVTRPLATTDDHTGNITFTDKYMGIGNNNHMRKILKKSVDDKFHAPGSANFESVVAHEMGHTLEIAILKSDSDEANDALNELLESYDKEHVISTYSLESDSECLAEHFAAVLFPNPATTNNVNVKLTRNFVNRLARKTGGEQI